MEDNYEKEILNQNLRKAQLRMVDILREVDRICRKHNLRYWIDYGTLLGAVRHHGHFIPWDDDLDICMPSEDYQKLKKIAPEELSKQFFLQTEESDPESPVGIGIMRVRDTTSLYLSQSENLSVKDNKGIYIDIYEMIYSPHLPFCITRWILRRISFSYNFFKWNPKLNFHNIVCYFWYPIQYLIFKTIWIGLHKNKNLLTQSPEECVYSSILHINNLYPLQEIEFEGLKVFAPNNIDKRLRDTYGDYMKMPTPEKRRVHAKYIILNIEDAKI